MTIFLNAHVFLVMACKSSPAGSQTHYIPINHPDPCLASCLATNLVLQDPINQYKSLFEGDCTGKKGGERFNICGIKIRGFPGCADVSSIRPE